MPTFVALNLAHTGDRVTSFPGNTGLVSQKLPAYTTLDLNGGISVGRFDVGAYVRNLTDARGQVSADTSFSSVGAPTWVTVVRPRTIGLTAGRMF